MVGYVAILAALRDSPSSTRGVVEDGLCGRTAANSLIPAMHKLGLVHISGWEQRYKAPARPKYKAGEGEDASAPTVRDTGRDVKAIVAPIKAYVAPPELLAFHDALEALREPMSCAQLREATGLAEGTVRALFAALLQHNMARIASYERQETGGSPVAMYVLGRGKSAVRPERDKAATNERYRIKRRQVYVLHMLAGQCAYDPQSEAAA